MRYTTLLIDADDTLLDFGTAEYEALKASFEELGYAFDDGTFSVYHEVNDALWKAFERGETDKSVIRIKRFGDLFEKCGLSGDPAAMAETYITMLSRQGQLIPGARDLLEKLYGHFDLYAVTNGIEQVQKSRFDRADLWRYFGDVFISERVGYGKPDRRYFDFVLAHVREKDPARIAVIGDSPTSDIRGATGAGLDSIWFDRRGIIFQLETPPTYTAHSYEEILDILFD